MGGEAAVLTAAAAIGAGAVSAVVSGGHIFIVALAGVTAGNRTTVAVACATAAAAVPGGSVSLVASASEAADLTVIGLRQAVAESLVAVGVKLDDLNSAESDVPCPFRSLVRFLFLVWLEN